LPFGQFILGKIIKIVVTRSHHLKLKCIRSKFDFGWSLALNHAGGAHRAPIDTLAGFYGILLLIKGKGKGKNSGMESRGKGGKEKEGRKGEGKGG